MFEDFMIRAALSGIALSMVTGPVGCLILWRKLAYFGDTLAHSALLGVVVALFLQIDAVIGVFVIASLISLAMIALRRMSIFSGDAALGILSHSALALGLIAISVSDTGNLHLNSILFGDILAVSWQDVWVSAGVAFVILLSLIKLWRTLIAQTVSSEITNAEGIGLRGSEIVFMILCSGLVAIAMKITGVLLISALLILPAAIARIFARSPEQMAVLAAIVGAVCVVGGLMASLQYDVPSGPAIIVTAAALFVVGLILSRFLSMFYKEK